MKGPRIEVGKEVVIGAKEAAETRAVVAAETMKAMGEEEKPL